jgi:hypothetical protein
VRVGAGGELAQARSRARRSRRASEEEGGEPEQLAQAERLVLTTSAGSVVIVPTAPKRLTISIVAATTLDAAGLATGQELGMIAVYVLLASLLVWVPVVVYVIAGTRSEVWLEDAEKWMAENQQSFTIFTLLVFGVLLLADGLVQLV